LRDLVNANVSLGQASGEGQGGSGKQGSQGFHRLFLWVIRLSEFSVSISP
jgi:hypothetical protein